MYKCRITAVCSKAHITRKEHDLESLMNEAVNENPMRVKTRN